MTDNRRPISSRSTSWARAIAKRLSERNITPNQISVASIAFAALGALSLLYFKEYGGLILCILFIQARLLCNLFDGMVAIEGQKKTASGPLFNEFPDRVADSLLLIALGYAVFSPALGWLAALLAFATAYIRVFAGTVNIPQTFIGPMAKQHRMAVMCIACLIAQVEWLYNHSLHSLYLSLLIIIVGAAWTCYNRTVYLLVALKSQEQSHDNI